MKKMQSFKALAQEFSKSARFAPSKNAMNLRPQILKSCIVDGAGRFEADAMNSSYAPFMLVGLKAFPSAMARRSSDPFSLSSCMSLAALRGILRAAGFISPE
ncbi:MAG: hypothetical protein LBU32_05945 [Clostridiales bacterium]|nr:hypothetical protein [Clostridiales bacterium]